MPVRMRETNKRHKTALGSNTLLLLILAVRRINGEDVQQVRGNRTAEMQKSCPHYTVCHQIAIKVISNCEIS